MKSWQLLGSFVIYFVGSYWGRWNVWLEVMRQWNVEKIRDGVLDSAVRSPLWFTASLKLNEESKITILTYESMWEVRPFTRFMRFPRSSGYKNHSIKGAVCTFATSRPNFANGPPQICAQAEDRSHRNPIFFTNHGFF